MVVENIFVQREEEVRVEAYINGLGPRMPFCTKGASIPPTSERELIKGLLNVKESKTPVQPQDDPQYPILDANLSRLPVTVQTAPPASSGPSLLLHPYFYEYNLHSPIHQHHPARVCSCILTSTIYTHQSTGIIRPESALASTSTIYTHQSTSIIRPESALASLLLQSTLTNPPASSGPSLLLHPYFYNLHSPIHQHHPARVCSCILTSTIYTHQSTSIIGPSLLLHPYFYNLHSPIHQHHPARVCSCILTSTIYTHQSTSIIRPESALASLYFYNLHSPIHQHHPARVCSSILTSTIYTHQSTSIIRPESALASLLLQSTLFFCASLNAT
ncbi:hypothetical protein J6590_036103 [Homalodisca vitripennis]|nr:hypothetical protein J6590_036103 [Homalodisca vitripennis]